MMKRLRHLLILPMTASVLLAGAAGVAAQDYFPAPPPSPEQPTPRELPRSQPDPGFGAQPDFSNQSPFGEPSDGYDSTQDGQFPSETRDDSQFGSGAYDSYPDDATSQQVDRQPLDPLNGQMQSQGDDLQDIPPSFEGEGAPVDQASVPESQPFDPNQPATADGSSDVEGHAMAQPDRPTQNTVAEFTGIDKITGRTHNFDVYIDETVQFGALLITPRVCISRPDAEKPQTDSFIEVDEMTLDQKIRRIFSGWMFAESPGLNAVEHAVYDVWLTDCKMTSDTTPPDQSASAEQS